MRNSHFPEPNRPFPYLNFAVMIKEPLVSILDWDDTLCPTTWLHVQGLLVAHGLIDRVPSMDIETLDQKATPSPLTQSDRKRLEQLEDHVLELLQVAAQFGPVFIVTAASLSWVVASAEHFLPRVRQFLLDNQRQCESGQSDRVQVVSARDWYHHHVGSGCGQLEWKCATFEALCSHLKVPEVFARLKLRTDLVSIGDARFEQEACVRMEMKASEFLRSKTMKLIDQPTLEELVEQVQMICSVYDRICRYDSGLHLCVTRKQNEAGTSSDCSQSFRYAGNVVEGSEWALETLQLRQIDQKSALEGPTAATESNVRLGQLLAAANALTHKAHYGVLTERGDGIISSQKELPLAAVPGVKS